MHVTAVSHRALILSICVAQFVMPFMLAGLNAVLPPIGADMLASARELSLIGTFYALGLAVFQLTSGRMGDVWGRRRIFLTGMGIFSLTGAAIGFVNDIDILLALRLVQGAGAAMFNATGLAILVAAAPQGMRGRYLGLSGAAAYSGIACGPPVAGLVAGMFGWRWLFWGNALAGIMAFALMYFTVRAEWYEGRGDPFDWRGGFVYGASMTALTLGATYINVSPTIGWGLLGLGVILLCLYVYAELRTKHPLLDVRLLVKNPVFGLSSLAAFINYSAMFGMLFYFSIYLQVVRGFDVIYAGLFLALQSAIQAISTPWAGRMADKYGADRISAIGIALCGVGLCAAAFLGRDTPIWYLTAAQVLLGLGISLFAIPNTTMILESVDQAHIGQAASLTGAVRTGGGLFNMVIISTTLGIYVGHEPVSAATIGPFLEALRVDLILFGVLNLAAIGCALGRLRL